MRNVDLVTPRSRRHRGKPVSYTHLDVYKRQIVYGPHLFGTISGRWTVYKDPWLDVTGSGGGPVGGAETMLLGYKGSTPLDTGYVYSIPRCDWPLWGAA